MRLDRYLVENGTYPSRNKAQEAIKNGFVTVNGQTEKASYKVAEQDLVSTSQNEQYVSRAAYKLLKMIEVFNIDFNDKVVLDVGSSTGGFTEVALKYGAKEVYSVDVGKNQLHYSLRSNNKVKSIEETNILDIEPNTLPKIDMIVMDVSFVSITKLMVHLSKFTNKFYVLIKPQFETNGKFLHKGIIKDKKVHQEVIENIRSFLSNNKLYLKNTYESPITGKDGNKEFLAHIIKL